MERLRKKDTPYPFNSRRAAGEIVPKLFREEVTLGSKHLEDLVWLNRLLENLPLENMIEKGEVTLGIIKPNAHEARGLPKDDDLATAFLLDEIGRENILLTFSTKLNQDQIDTFYKDVKEKYEGVKDEITKRDIWGSVSAMLNSGPVTFVLFYRKQADAIPWWREKMGRTDPKYASPDSIRGKYGIKELMPNNLTHGSDSIKNAKWEVSVFRSIVSEVTDIALAVSKRFPSEQVFKSLGVLEKKDILLSIRKIWDSGMRDESWIYAYHLDYYDKNGTLNSKLIKEKNIISMGWLLSKKAADEVARLKHLESIGIKVPHIYGVLGASIYEDFILEDTANEIFEKFRSKTSLTRQEQGYLTQLLDITAKLDREGYRPLGFLNDLIFNPETDEFILVDGGGDLAERESEPTKKAFELLVASFPKHREFIQKTYQSLRKLSR